MTTSDTSTFNGRPVRRIKPTETLERFRKSKPEVAGPVRITAMSMRETYNPGKDLLTEPARVGADDALAIPSRFNDHLHYRDGRVVPVNSGDQ